jgi:hypothetical protein
MRLSVIRVPVDLATLMLIIGLTFKYLTRTFPNRIPTIAPAIASRT